MHPPFKWWPQNEIEQWRFNTFYEKEPETLEWIRLFKDKEIFWDIGANIGVYSLFSAAIHPFISIMAFEPSQINLNRFVELINLNEFISILPVRLALGGEGKFVKFIDKDPRSGSAGGEIIECNWFDDNAFPQTTIDRLVSAGMAIPTHIKIDVDGGEFGIIQGGLYTLGQPECKSLLVELDPTCTNIPLVCELMKQKGFTMNNEFNTMDNHSKYRRMRENIIVENVVFTK